MAYTRLDSGLLAHVNDLAAASPALNSGGEDELNSPMLQEEDELIEMPSSMHLLTTYYSFNLIDLPPDFNRLVKQYYTKQCRGCQR